MLKEKIEATESLIALDLDQRRNELTAFDLVLTIVTLSVAFVSMVASIFGQNLYWSTTQSPLVSPLPPQPAFPAGPPRTVETQRLPGVKLSRGL